MTSKLVLFPSTAEVNNKGHLLIGGCDTTELAAEFSTPLYVFDELGIRNQCAEFKQEFSQRYADTAVFYSAKAFINKALAKLLDEEGLGLDVVGAAYRGLADGASRGAFVEDEAEWGVSGRDVVTRAELDALVERALEIGQTAADGIREGRICRTGGDHCAWCPVRGWCQESAA